MRKALLSILFLFFIFFAWAQKKKQSRNNLEKQRTSLLREIAQTEKELSSLQKSKSSSLEALKVLQRKLTARNKLLNNLDKEVKLLDRGITQANGKIGTLRTQLKGMRKQYAELVRFSYKNRTSENFLLFLFSAKSFNDANRRLSYVKQYRNFRADQAKKIEQTSISLQKTAERLRAQRKDKDQALKTQQSQNAALVQETVQQNKMVLALKSQEGVLKKKLVTKKQTAAKLNNAISIAIKREVEAARKRAMAEQLKKKRAELARKEKEKREARALAAKKEAERKAALAKKKREEEQRKLALEKTKREEAARKLAADKKKREQEEMRLAMERKKRIAEERKAKALAEKKRKEREAELARQKKEQEERASALKKKKERQEQLRLQLEAEKKRQREEERRLAREKKRRDKERRKLAAERKQKEAERLANAKKTGEYKNPRYNPSLAEKERAAKREAEAKRLAKESVKNNYSIALTPAERNLSSNFEANQGRLPWPVASGYIVERFGKNKHPVFNIYTENYGIDIKTNKSQAAYSIFAGEVSSVIFIPGAGQTVLVNHGSFYTVYSKLKNVSVQKGQKIKLKQVLGRVKTDENGSTQIHFEIWKIGADGSPYKVNPESWVRKS